MSSFEQLRMIARHGGFAQNDVIEAAAQSIGHVQIDHAMLLTSLRGLLKRHPTNAALWNYSATVLTAMEPQQASEGFVDMLRNDITNRHLAVELPPDGAITIIGFPHHTVQALLKRGDVSSFVLDVAGQGSDVSRELRRAEFDSTDVPVWAIRESISKSSMLVLEAVALHGRQAVMPSGSTVAALCAQYLSCDICIVVPQGVCVDTSTFGALSTFVENAGKRFAYQELFDVSLGTMFIESAGRSTIDRIASRVDASSAAELLAVRHSGTVS